MLYVANTGTIFSTFLSKTLEIYCLGVAETLCYCSSLFISTKAGVQRSREEVGAVCFLDPALTQLEGFTSFVALLALLFEICQKN